MFGILNFDANRMKIKDIDNIRRINEWLKTTKTLKDMELDYIADYNILDIKAKADDFQIEVNKPELDQFTDYLSQLISTGQIILEVKDGDTDPIIYSIKPKRVIEFEPAEIPLYFTNVMSQYMDDILNAAEECNKYAIESIIDDIDDLLNEIRY